MFSSQSLATAAVAIATWVVADDILLDKHYENELKLMLESRREHFIAGVSKEFSLASIQ